MKKLKNLLPGLTELSIEIPDVAFGKNPTGNNIDNGLTDKQRQSLNEINALLEELRNR